MPEYKIYITVEKHDENFDEESQEYENIIEFEDQTMIFQSEKNAIEFAGTLSRVGSDIADKYQEDEED